MTEILSPEQINRVAVMIDTGKYIDRKALRSLAYTARVLLAQRRMLAKLASETPQFDNPLLVFEAQRIRDEVLAAPSPIPDNG